jgi:hypothetical protein
MTMVPEWWDNSCTWSLPMGFQAAGCMMALQQMIQAGTDVVL